MEIALRQDRDFGTAETLYAAQLQADWLALWCGFDRRHDRRLARRTAAPLAAVALPAEIGVVDFDPSRQALCGVPLHHRLHQLVLDLPGGGVGDDKPGAQLNAGDAALALSEVVHGAKPSAQRHLGCCENRSGDHGCLPPTGGTLVKRPGLDEAVMLPCANRADKAGWPAPAHHGFPARILCSVKNSKVGLAEPLLKLHLVARHHSTRRNSRMFLFCTLPRWLRIVRNQENFFLCEVPHTPFDQPASFIGHLADAKMSLTWRTIMPNPDNLYKSATRSELDHSSSDASLRLEYVARLLVVRPLPKQSLLRPFLRRLRSRTPIGRPIEGKPSDAN